MNVYRLPNRLPGEKVLKKMRKHFIVFFIRILLFILIIFLSTTFGFIMMILFPYLIYQPLYYAAIVLSISVYALFLWLFFFFSFVDYYLDVYIITNERIINIRQQGFFSRTISEQRLYRIQDITSEAKGVLPTIFKYGNVYIQTAAEVERFVFEQIPGADHVRDYIIKLAEDSKHRHPGEV